MVVSAAMKALSHGSTPELWQGVLHWAGH